MAPGNGSSSISSLYDSEQVAVERALSDLRAGRPVVIHTDGSVGLAIGVEALDETLAVRLEEAAHGKARLVLPAARLRRLGIERANPGILALPEIDLERIERLSLSLEGTIDAPVSVTSELDETALELARIAMVLPAMVVVPLAQVPVGSLFAQVDAGAVHGYRAAQVRTLKIVGRAPVPLEGAPQTEFVVFRGGEGLRDHVAIVVGRPDLSAPVSVRLHSACLTGDLFGSLKCDCGDQLRDTARRMAEGEGGIILYLDQEGRGNGISNKMRAYRLQSMGMDTYDADEVLGFDIDQRRFDFAAEMLKQLGIKRVRLMTNNPEKIAAVRRAGLDLVADQRVLGRRTAENVRYLASKRDRAGHFIDVDALAVQGALSDPA